MKTKFNKYIGIIYLITFKHILVGDIRFILVPYSCSAYPHGGVIKILYFLFLNTGVSPLLALNH